MSLSHPSFCSSIHDVSEVFDKDKEFIQQVMGAPNLKDEYQSSQRIWNLFQPVVNCEQLVLC